MINKTDLRIGNSVMYKGIAWEVEELKESAISLRNNGIGWIRRIYDDINPIPITEEALVKMGAIVTKKNNYNLNGMAITNFNGKFIEYVHQIELKGIHHLQNVYYFTRQTELTYEP